MEVWVRPETEDRGVAGYVRLKPSMTIAEALTKIGDTLKIVREPSGTHRLKRGSA
jgi:hypothetical protein